MNNKVILIDFGIFQFRSIYAWRNNRAIPPTYTALNMIISSLKKIGVDPDDEIIVAVDSEKGSWRKDFDSNYKADRKGKREQQTDIDWTEVFNSFDELLDTLKVTSPFHIVKVDKMEADDIIAVGCRTFKDNECVIVSYDQDYEQLCALENVKIFSPIKKFKGKKGAYKQVKSPYAILAKKIEKEASDNLVNPILNEEDFEIRKTIVSLLELPDFVELPIQNKLTNLEEKEYDLNEFPFDSLRNRFRDIYNSTEIVDYEESINYKKKTRKKKAK